MSQLRDKETQVQAAGGQVIAVGERLASEIEWWTAAHHAWRRACDRRDREVEAIHRGNEYVRAIQLYYKKFGRYPGNMDQLEKSNNIRFLRQRYVDPMTGKELWKIPQPDFSPAPRPLFWHGLAYFVSDVVDNLDLSAMDAVYGNEKRGQPPYDPVMMTKVLV